MLPVIIRTTEEMLRLVPDELRQASLALGRPQVADDPVGRAARGDLRHRQWCDAGHRPRRGETAPIVLVVGLAYRINWSISAARTRRCPPRSSRTRPSPTRGAEARAWGAALTLMVIVLLTTTLIGRFLAGRFAIKER